MRSAAAARRPPSRRARARLATVLSAAGALLLAVTFVWQSASAGFTDSTTALRAGTTTGTVVLADDDKEAKLFSSTGLTPGQSAGTRCIAVTSTGTAPADVRLYATGASTSQALSSWLDVTVQIGTGGAYAGCSGFKPSAVVFSGRLATFPADSWSAGKASWTTTGGTETRTYQVTVGLAAGAPKSVQGGSAAATFVWEAQSRARS